MIQYIKDSIRELKHVVWPTREETTDYFVTVVLVLFLFGVYLFVTGSIFQKALFIIKDTFGKTTQVQVNKDLSNLPDNVLKNIINSWTIEKETKLNSGKVKITNIKKVVEAKPATKETKEKTTTEKKENK